MNKTIHLTLLLLFAYCFLPINSSAQETNPVNGPFSIIPNYYVLVNASVFSNNENKMIDATIVVKNGIIENFGKGIPIPKDALLIDLKGKYVYPSFIDLYSNYGLNITNNTKGNAQYNTNKKALDYEGFFYWYLC